MTGPTWDDMTPDATYDKPRTRVRRTGSPPADPVAGELAAGGDATAAGMDTVASTDPIGQGFDEINMTRDYVAQYARRTGPLIDVWVQSTAPAHKVDRIWIKKAP